MKNICVSTEAWQKVKIQLIEWEKNFANHVSDNGPVPRIYKEFLQLNNRKVNNSIFKKWAEDLNRHCSINDVQMASKLMKI